MKTNTPKDLKKVKLKIKHGDVFNRLEIIKGETLCISEWAKKLSINYVTLQSRLYRGWDIKKALYETI